MTKSIDYKSLHAMYTLLGFYMREDSRYDSNYRKNVYWISATTSVWDTKIDADIEHSIIFFGDSTCSVEGTPQIHLYQYVATPSTSKVTINIILYAYDNNPTPIPK